MKTLLVVSLGLFYGVHGAGNSLSSGGFKKGISSTISFSEGGGVEHGFSCEGLKKGINTVSYFLEGGVSRGYVSMKGGDGARGGFKDSDDGLHSSVCEGGRTGNGFAESGDKGHAIQ